MDLPRVAKHSCCGPPHAKIPNPNRCHIRCRRRGDPAGRSAPVERDACRRTPLHGGRATGGGSLLSRGAIKARRGVGGDSLTATAEVGGGVVRLVAAHSPPHTSVDWGGTRAGDSGAGGSATGLVGGERGGSGREYPWIWVLRACRGGRHGARRHPARCLPRLAGAGELKGQRAPHRRGLPNGARISAATPSRSLLAPHSCSSHLPSISPCLLPDNLFTRPLPPPPLMLPTMRGLHRTVAAASAVALAAAIVLAAASPSAAAPAQASATTASPSGDKPAPAAPVTYGPRPFFLVDGVRSPALRSRLAGCAGQAAARSDWSIGHRGAPLMFPEHTKESYIAAARMGAGIIECTYVSAACAWVAAVFRRARPSFAP